MSSCLPRLVSLLVAIAAIAPVAAAAGQPQAGHRQAVRALHTAEGLFTDRLAAGGSPTREATPALRDLAVALPALHGARARRAQELLRRPTDDGREYFGREADASPTCNAQFCVHWTDEGNNAPDSPDFVGQVVAALDRSSAVENGTLGWQSAKSDGDLGARHGIGSDGQVDVYITNLSRDLYGYAAPDSGQKGSRRFAYLVLDNNYLGFPSSPLDSLNVTVAHEYNHILQFNYDTYEDVWMFESSATWAEEQVYPDDNDYLNYLPTLARQSKLPFTGRDVKIYAEAVWNHWLTSRYGPEVVRDAWAASRDGVKPPHLATAAYKKAIRTHGGLSFAAEFGDFAAATAEWQSSSSFPDAAVYPDVKRRGTLTRRPQKSTFFNTSYRLLSVTASGSKPIALRVKAPRGIASSIALVGREGPTPGGVVTTRIRHLPKGGRGTVKLTDPGRFTRITAVIVDDDGRLTPSAQRYRGDGANYRYVLK